MSWHRCVTAETYPLAIPGVVVLALGAGHLLALVITAAAGLAPDLIVLVWLLVVRSWHHTRRTVQAIDGAVLSIGARGRILIHETSRRLADESGAAARCAGTVAGERTNGPGARPNPMWPDDVGERPKHGVIVSEYTCCRSVQIPGCVSLTLVTGHGKLLEILVFYRYDQRQFYHRLRRFLAYR